MFFRILKFVVFAVGLAVCQQEIDSSTTSDTIPADIDSINFDNVMMEADQTSSYMVPAEALDVAEKVDAASDYAQPVDVATGNPEGSVPSMIDTDSQGVSDPLGDLSFDDTEVASTEVSETLDVQTIAQPNEVVNADADSLERIDEVDGDRNIESTDSAVDESASYGAVPEPDMEMSYMEFEPEYIAEYNPESSAASFEAASSLPDYEAQIVEEPSRELEETVVSEGPDEVSATDYIGVEDVTDFGKFVEAETVSADPTEGTDMVFDEADFEDSMVEDRFLQGIDEEATVFEKIAPEGVSEESVEFTENELVNLRGSL